MQDREARERLGGEPAQRAAPVFARREAQREEADGHRLEELPEDLLHPPASGSLH